MTAPLAAPDHGNRGLPRGLTLAALTALYCLDALVLGLGFVAFGLLLVSLALVAKWLLLRATPSGATAQHRTARLALSLTLCAVAIMVTINLNNQLARERANRLVAAIDHYRAIAGRYPQRLEDLVPTYIDAVPRAKFTLSFNRFDFAHRQDGAVLAYAQTPPFGRAIYDFKAQRWEALLR